MQRWAVSRCLYRRYVSRDIARYAILDIARYAILDIARSRDILYRYRYRLSVSLQYRVSVSIKHVFVHRRYKYLDTVFEHDQSYQVLTACSFVRRL